MVNGDDFEAKIQEELEKLEKQDGEVKLLHLITDEENVFCEEMCEKMSERSAKICQEKEPICEVTNLQYTKVNSLIKAVEKSITLHVHLERSKLLFRQRHLRDVL